MKNTLKYVLAASFALSPLTTASAQGFHFGPPASGVEDTTTTAPPADTTVAAPSPLAPATPPAVSPTPQLSSTPFEVVGDLTDPNAKPKPARDPEPFIDFNESDLTYDNWMTRYFKLIVVINKAPSAAKTGTPIVARPGGPQTISLYQKNRDGSFSLIVNRPISSGRDHFEAISEATGRVDEEGFSQTHTGYFQPTELHIDHRSGAYTHDDHATGGKIGSLMKWSAFFNKNEGEAIHQVPGGSEGMLGHRASGGCVRQDAATAEYIFWRIRYTGGPLEKGTCFSDETGKEFVEIGNPLFEEAYAQRQQMPGWGPLPAEGTPWPQVPRMKPDGTGMVLDKINEKGEFVPKYRNGFPVLFIVFYKRDNRPDPRDEEQVTLQTANSTYIVADSQMMIDAHPGQPPIAMADGPAGGGTQQQVLVGVGDGAECVVAEDQIRRPKRVDTSNFHGYQYKIGNTICLEGDDGTFLYKVGRRNGKTQYAIVQTTYVLGEAQGPNNTNVMPGFEQGVQMQTQVTTVEKVVVVPGTYGGECLALDRAVDLEALKGASRHYFVDDVECVINKKNKKYMYRVDGGWNYVETQTVKEQVSVQVPVQSSGFQPPASIGNGDFQFQQQQAQPQNDCSASGVFSGNCNPFSEWFN